MITTKGPAKAAINPGKVVFSLFSSAGIVSFPFLESKVERTTVTINAPTAGMGCKIVHIKHLLRLLIGILVPL